MGGFVGLLAQRSKKIATIEEITAASADGWSGTKERSRLETSVLARVWSGAI
jgi:hypothetical protein